MKALLLLLATVFLAYPAYAVDKKEAPAGAAAAPTAVAKPPTTICTAEVLYKWKRLPPPPAPLDAASAARKAKGTLPPPLPPDPEIYGTMENSALTLSESGPIETEVKARIEEQLPGALGHAMELCVELHQNQGTCLSKKLGAVSAQLDRLDFETKKAIREQSSEDCKKEHGVCLSTSKSEITCRQEILPTPAPTEAPAAKDVKKK